MSPQWSLWIEKVWTRRVGGEHAPRAVAVVLVEVDHQHGLREAARAQPPDRHRHVVEDAEAETGVGLRVVEAAAEVRRDAPRLQREPRRLDRPARHQALELERALGLGGRHLDAEDARERPCLLQLVEVLGRVDAQQVLERGRLRLGHEVGAQEARLRERALDLLAPQRVQGNAEDALAIAGVVDDRDAAPAQPAQRPAGGPQDSSEGAVAHQADSVTLDGPRDGSRGCAILDGHG